MPVSSDPNPDLKGVLSMSQGRISSIVSNRIVICVPKGLDTSKFESKELAFSSLAVTGKNGVEGGSNNINNLRPLPISS